jgi:hypothetical protein
MKKLMHKLSAVVMSLVSAAASIQSAEATNVTLDGSGYYSNSTYAPYYQYGTAQSGRYTNLGADYYHSSEIGIDQLTNRSSYRSGTMSFEFWAMPYYGATSGIILMTKSVSSLWGGYSYYDLSRSGKAISLNRYRYPELDLFEYTNYGWKWRDALSFSRKSYL